MTAKRGRSPLGLAGSTVPKKNVETQCSTPRQPNSAADNSGAGISPTHQSASRLAIRPVSPSRLIRRHDLDAAVSRPSVEAVVTAYTDQPLLERIPETPDVFGCVHRQTQSGSGWKALRLSQRPTRQHQRRENSAYLKTKFQVLVVYPQLTQKARTKHQHLNSRPLADREVGRRANRYRHTCCGVAAAHVGDFDIRRRHRDVLHRLGLDGLRHL